MQHDWFFSSWDVDTSIPLDAGTGGGPLEQMLQRSSPDRAYDDGPTRRVSNVSRGGGGGATRGSIVPGSSLSLASCGSRDDLENADADANSELCMHSVGIRVHINAANVVHFRFPTRFPQFQVQ